jgi:hypothetical protein
MLRTATVAVMPLVAFYRGQIEKCEKPMELFLLKFLQNQEMDNQWGAEAAFDLSDTFRSGTASKTSKVPSRR